MEMNDRFKELIAIGASITANCQPCLQYHVEKAIQSGADQQEVAAAIEIGHRVRKGAAAKMDAYVAIFRPGLPKENEVVMEGNCCQFPGP